MQLANLRPGGNPANRGRAGLGGQQGWAATWGRKPSQKGVLRSEFARQSGRESRPQGPEGHAERGAGGAVWARAEPVWVRTHEVQATAPSASLGYLSGMPTPGPPRPAASEWACEPHPQGSLRTQKSEKRCFRVPLRSARQTCACYQDPGRGAVVSCVRGSHF